MLLASSLGVAATSVRHASAAPVSGGTLKIGYTEDYVTFDPAEASGIDEGTLYATLYSGLYQLDKNNQPQLDLAAAPPVITNHAKVWTFKIRKGVLFSNGTELTANDVKYSILRVLSPKLKPISYAQQDDNIFVGSDAYTKGKASDVSGIQVLDKYTIRFQLTNPLPLLPNILGQGYNKVV
ncbi:MAG: ABC transporter substrate-binding protein, partial [Chloroflexota bacterium]